MKVPQKKAQKAAGAALPPLPPEEAAALQELVARVAAALESGAEAETLRDLVGSRPEDAAWDLHLLDRLAALAQPAIPALLASLFGTSPDKARQKALKRALHLLKTRGVPVPHDLLPREKAGEQPSGRAHLSQVFGDGARYLVLESSREGLGGNFVVVLLSDRDGIREWHPMSLNRRKQQELWEYFRKQGLGEWVLPPPAYAAGLLEEAYTRSDMDGAAAGRYRAVRELIRRQWGSPQEAPTPEQLLPPLDPGEQKRWLEQSRQLPHFPLFHTWLPGLEEVSTWLEKLAEVQNSPLILSEPQRQAREQQVLEEATAELFPAESRPLWQRRLLEMAYFLELRGQGPEARSAHAAAVDLARPDRSLLQGENPFLLELVLMSVSMARELRQKEDEQGQGLVQAAPPLIHGR